MGMSQMRVVLLAVLAAGVLAGCARTELLQGLDERQANEVVAVLLRNNIDASKQATGKTGFRVRVGAADLAEAIGLVQYHDLPSQPRVQVAQQFPADAMVSTPLAERARLLSAIEQRLEESLASLAGVHVARVHVSYDGIAAESAAAHRKPSPMHVSAVLVHEDGADATLLVQLSKRFLRNAFVDIGYDDISVVLSAASPARSRVVIPAAETRLSWRTLALAGLLGLLGAGLLWHLRGGRMEPRPWSWLQRLLDKVRRKPSAVDA